MKTRTLFALGAVAIALLVPSTSRAEDLNGMGSQTQMILSADRLVPVFAYSSVTVTSTQGGTTTKVSEGGSSTSILWGAEGSSGSLLGSRSPHTVPRVGFDFALGQSHFTVGGAVAFGFSLGGSRETERTQNNQTTTVTVDSPSQTVIGFAPRFGYILPFGEVFGFWPRGGFSVYSLRSTTEDTDNNGRTRDTDKATVVSLDLDPQFVIAPLEHFFINVGPIINVPLTGSITNERVRGATTTTLENDLTVWHIGLTAGLGGWFDL